MFLLELKAEVKPEHLPHNPHDRNHLLARALRSVAHSHFHKDKPDYDFEDWEFVLYLIGERDHPFAADYAGSNTTNTIRKSPVSSKVTAWKGEDGLFDWFDENSPLNVSETVTEWMLLVLVEVLEDELRRLRQQTKKFEPGEKS